MMSNDDREMALWWNRLPVPQRLYWLEQAASPQPADAWRAYQHSNARLAPAEIDAIKHKVHAAREWMRAEMARIEARGTFYPTVSSHEVAKRLPPSRES